jgi:ribosome-interacting GTPase 1
MLILAQYFSKKCASYFELLTFFDMVLVIQELDIIYKIPHTVPISAHHKWNFDDLLEMMWDYLSLTRM